MGKIPLTRASRIYFPDDGSRFQCHDDSITHSYVAGGIARVTRDGERYSGSEFDETSRAKPCQRVKSRD